MAQAVSTDVVALIRKYLDVLKSRNIPVSRAYVFGSYANHTNTEWSDIEVA